MLWSCIAHCTLPPLAHTFSTLVMHWSIPCFFILAYHVYLMLCNILFCLLFELHFSFILHPSCIFILVHIFISCPRFSLILFLFVLKKGESILLSSIPKSFVISIWLLCTFLGGEILFLVHICRGRDIPWGEIFHGGDAYTKGEKTLC